MNIPEELRYAKSHEWVRELEGGIVEIGISDFAQSELGDIVFVSLPAVGDTLEAGKSFADVESVKAVSGIFSPVNGTVTEINNALVDAPESINKEPYSAWLIRAKGCVTEGALLAAADYKAQL
jgi:glycine cleavage system H protein